MSNKVTTIPREGLVGEWLLDGDSLDTSGNGNHGTATNVTYTNTDRGYQSQCGAFDGSSSYINLGDSSLHDGIDNITLSAWIKPTTIKDSYFFTKDDVTNRSWSFDTTNYTGHVNELDAQFFVGGSASYAHTGGILQSGVWQMVTVTRDSSGVIEFYYNGIKTSKTQLNTVPGTLNNSSASSEIGRRNYGPQPGYFDGNIQLPRIYNRVLSSKEIQSLYMEGLRKLGGAGLAPLTDGLVAMFETDGSTPLYNVIGGTVATYVGGTATTDIFGNTKAIANPNYTWSSITYTIGYSFENSGSGWALVTSPSGLSATGINRTTTLGRIFLFSRTLSASEVTALELLCKNSYPYPF